MCVCVHVCVCACVVSVAHCLKSRTSSSSVWCGSRLATNRVEHGEAASPFWDVLRGRLGLWKQTEGGRGREGKGGEGG